MRLAFVCVGLAIGLMGCDRGPAQQAAAPSSAATEPADHDTTPEAEPEEVVVAAPPSPVIFEARMDGLPEKGMWKCDPVFADVNRDGHLDLAALPRIGTGPVVWLGSADGSWTESSSGLKPERRSCGGGIAFADVNLDGHLDLTAADHCAGLFVYLGDGKGNWEMATAGLFPEDLSTSASRPEMYKGTEDVAVGDINGDGHADLVGSASDDGGINVYYGDGSGAVWTRASLNGLPPSGWATRIVLHDVNEDETPDLVASYSEGPRVWLNDGEGTFTAAYNGLPTPVMKGLFTGIAMGDINKDGRVDLAVANWIDGPEVYLQGDDVSWHKTDDVFPEMLGGAVGLALGDIDRDGHLDMVTTGRLAPDKGNVRGVFVLFGDGAGAWRYAPDSGLPVTGLSATSGVALGDVDGDEMLDVAASAGLIVENSSRGPKQAIPHNMLFWRSMPAGDGAHAHDDVRTGEMHGSVNSSDRVDR